MDHDPFLGYQLSPKNNCPTPVFPRSINVFDTRLYLMDCFIFRDYQNHMTGKEWLHKPTSRLMEEVFSRIEVIVFERSILLPPKGIATNREPAAPSIMGQYHPCGMDTNCVITYGGWLI